jgi:pimeloyl-ACP methyl ester carboxylesterase
MTLANQVIAEFDSQSGVLFVEALMPTFRNIVLRVMCNGEESFKVRLPMHVIPVRQMYDWHNYRAASGGLVSRASESVGSLNHPYGLEKAKKFFFLHGANVSEENAEKWGDAIFKRLWHAGCHVEFHNVDWRSDIGGSANYQQNASNAFAVASVIATDINAMSGDKVIMAHSLGNMVVSSMIQDHGLQVEKYMMCDSAVPAEAYDTTLSPTNLVVHSEWDEYPRRSFANEWYRLFLDDSSDDRRKSTWEGRFPMVRNVAVNFYSSKDHVLELFPTNVIGVADGYENWDQMFERYSWQKQELWKGRKGVLARMGTTDWSGWGMRKDWLGNAIVDPSNALHMAESVLKTNTVFKLQPASMNTNSIPRLVLDAHLTQGIPARTPATGLINICNEQMLGENFNLNSTDDEEGIPRPNGWPTRMLGWLFTTTWTDEWLHSDMKDVSYFYTYKFYEKVKQTGGLQ